jgi:signal peptidase II
MIYILIVIAFVLTEHKIKDYIDKNKELGDREEILGGKIIIRKHYNEGAFLNFMQEKKELLKTISCVSLGLLALLFIIVLPKKGKVLLKLGLSLILGGAISNVSDRVSRGHVIDYFTINTGKLKTVIFNLSDMAIFLGSLLILLASLPSAVVERSADKALK